MFIQERVIWVGGHDLSITCSDFVILSPQNSERASRIASLSHSALLCFCSNCMAAFRYAVACSFFPTLHIQLSPSHLGCSFPLAKRLTWEQISFLCSPSILVTTLSNNLQPIGGHVERRPIKFSLPIYDTGCTQYSSTARLRRWLKTSILNENVWHSHFNNTLKVRCSSLQVYICFGWSQKTIIGKRAGI